MKMKELRQLSLDELSEKEKELKKELFDLRFQRASGKLENSGRFGQVRKEIARVKTIEREKK
ncbi:50S ribosomal protein L29 [candidate division NPL-UPA2 bacterium Unc8]|uniref:Large ribosomal subunit protein uL29 n=1 Tax=candidate division NPL-UPA2 bacterium Unc8 TaxID=1980939 RepID=A0A399FV79_UNCN2|nr:50S ribosomal protein L29 [Bacillota bacterium]MBT9147242.1 50S ribosomal protein L29 [Bacillota bacterium]RII00298.1 MAG: 50S ribosomal protein L29 [candidate division NPL-UPA2 bacterium Unc8]